MKIAIPSFIYLLIFFKTFELRFRLRKIQMMCDYLECIPGHKSRTDCSQQHKKISL